jgi:hypothetical protein
MPDNFPDQLNEGDDDLKTQIRIRFKNCQTFYGDWEVLAKEDYDFALGDQWTAEDRLALNAQGRPCLTFNRIKPIINLISGYQRENSARIKVSPEGGEDRIFSEVFDRVLNAIDKWSKLSYKLGYQFDDGLYCGKGMLEGVIDYSKDPILGELKWVLNGPYTVYVDPECKEYDLNEGAEYLFKVCRFTKSRLEQMYPKKKKLIDGFVEDSDDEIANGSGALIIDDGTSYNTRKAAVSKTEDKEGEDELGQDAKFTYKEYWYKKYVKRFFVVNPETGSLEKFKTKKEAEDFISQLQQAHTDKQAQLTQGAQMIGQMQQMQQQSGQAPQMGTQTMGGQPNPDMMGNQGMNVQMPELPPLETPKIFERTVPEIWIAVQVCGFILQDEVSPFEPHYSGFPFFRFLADWAPSAATEEYRVQGITRALKDVQREKNKAKSQYLHILNTQANSGWVGDDNALTDAGWKALESMGSKPGIAIRKRPGTELREILPKGPNAGHIQREQAADEEFRQCSGINPDLLGMQEGGTDSGRAIALRIRQAVLSLARLFNNYKYTKECIGKFMIQMVPILFDAKKMAKVVGSQFMKANQLSEGTMQAYLQMVKDYKYDVEVAEASNSATMRYETQNTIMELMKTPQGQFVPIDLILDYMDVPNAEEVKQRVMQNQQQIMQAQAQAQEKQMQLETAKLQIQKEGQEGELALKTAQLAHQANQDNKPEPPKEKA